MGIALWLMPKPNAPLYNALQSTIDGLQPLFDDAYSFEPHITLTTGIEINSQKQVDWILNRAVIATNAVDYINVECSKLGYGSSFTHKIFFQVKKQPELMSLAQISREEFVALPRRTSQEKNYNALSEEETKNVENLAAEEAQNWVKNEYDPHVSLVYSNIYPVDEASKQMVEQRLTDIFGDDFEHRGLGWTNGRLQLMLCEGPVDEWKVLGYRDIP